jgi:hypothetical protein
MKSIKTINTLLVLITAFISSSFINAMQEQKQTIEIHGNITQHVLNQIMPHNAISVWIYVKTKPGFKNYTKIYVPINVIKQITSLKLYKNLTTDELTLARPHIYAEDFQILVGCLDLFSDNKQLFKESLNNLSYDTLLNLEYNSKSIGAGKFKDFIEKERIKREELMERM